MTGQQFKKTRKKIGITQSQCGLLMGMSGDSISRIETGRRGSAPTLQQAAAISVLLYIATVDFGMIEELLAACK